MKSEQSSAIKVVNKSFNSSIKFKKHYYKYNYNNLVMDTQ